MRYFCLSILSQARSHSTLSTLQKLQWPIQILCPGKACVSIDIPLKSKPVSIHTVVNTSGCLISSEFEKLQDSNKSKAQLRDEEESSLFLSEYKEYDEYLLQQKLPERRCPDHVLPINLLFNTAPGTGKIEIVASTSSTQFHIYIPVRVMYSGQFLVPITLPIS